jgi:hypothetical protein
MNQQFRITDIVIIVLIVILFLQKCGGGNTIYKPSITTVRDTVWIKKESTINSKPQIIQSIPFPVNSYTKEYIADTNYNKLVLQYQALVAKFLATNIQKDSLRIDSIGYIKITDTVSSNLVRARQINYKFKYPIIKETITIIPPPKTQVFWGIGIQGNNQELTQFTTSFLLKNKKEQMFGVQAGISPNGIVNYGVSTFWKIKL